MIYNFCVTLMILSTMYTTTIFGTDEITLSEVIDTVSEDIWEEIEKFRGENDGFFRETGYLKPYSRLLDLIQDCLPAISLVLYAAVLFRTLSKVQSKVSPILSCLYVGILTIGTVLATLIAYDSPLLVKNEQDEEFPEKLFIKKYRNEGFFENDEEYICFKENFIRDGIMTGSIEHYRPLADMRPKNTTSSNRALQTYIPLGDQDPGKLVYFKLENGEVNAYLPDDYRKSENKLHSLPTPERINSFALFKKREIMITTSERGIIQRESERNKELHKIMNSTEVT